MADAETVEISESEDEELFVDAEEWQWDNALEEHLRGLGVKPRREWLHHCLNSIANPNMTVAQQAEHCLSHFLFADFNTAGDVILPPNIHTLHATDIPGPFLLQVDEIVNLSSPLRDRYKEAPAGLKRCLKLSMTDGIQRVFGIEYRPIKDLKVLLPAGVKIVIQNVHVRRGLLMLVPEVVDVLGGFVEHLEAARERLVQEVNKPPRGRRNRRGEETLSLASRALAAAWPPECSNNIPVSNDAVPIAHALTQSSSPEVTVVDTGGETHQRNSIEILPTSGSMLNHQRNEGADISMDLDRLDLVDEGIYNQLLESDENKIPFTYLACLKARKQLESVVQGRIKVAETRFASNTIVLRRLVAVREALSSMVISQQWNIWRQSSSERATNIRTRILDETWWSRAEYLLSFTEPILSMIRFTDMDKPCLGEVYDGIDSMIENMRSVINAREQDPEENFCKEVQSICVERWNKMTTPLHLLAFALSPKYYSAEILALPTRVPPYRDAEVGEGCRKAIAKLFPNIEMEDVVTSEFVDFVSSTGQTLAAVRDKYRKDAHAWWYLNGHKLPNLQILAIKVLSQCILTGVKEFQFKERDKFELYVYIDDGSLISEVLIDHKVVHNIIGHSPREVTALLTSGDQHRVEAIKEAMKSFQVLLKKFEGQMLVEINDEFAVPVVIEMKEGCDDTWPWLLFRRCKCKHYMPQ